MYGKLYTLGYVSLEGVDQLQALFADDVLLIDIRYLPASRWKPEWSRKRLLERFAPNYEHIRDLGNVNYHSSNLPIQLFNSEQGIARIVSLLRQGRDICLLCACSDWHSCHRRLVADLVQHILTDIETIHLSRENYHYFRTTDQLLLSL
jgi:uncharacterized protein (DUF488 family)